MRNIFDQYSQPENRVTHALMTALSEDRALLRSFLDLVGISPPNPRTLALLEQRYPGEEEPTEEEAEKRGIPDGWIFNEDGWCVFLEAKVLMRPTADQIMRHRRTAGWRGFTDIHAVAVTPVPATGLPAGTACVEWRQVYTWLRAHAGTHKWAACVAEYLEIAEAQMVERQQLVEGTLTTFTGFPFGPDHSYTYLEGKRVLVLALNDLRKSAALQTELGMRPDLPGRPAITGRKEDRVWDFLPLAGAEADAAFTTQPHLTLGVRADQVEAMVTVPHAVNRTMRRNLRDLGEAGFQKMMGSVLENASSLLLMNHGAKPWFRGVQRRYPSQRSVPFVDASIEFDLRTAVPASGPPKAQPRWLEAAYGSFLDKAGANYQMQVGFLFPYGACPGVREPSATRLIEEAWLACGPLVALAR